MSRQRRNIKHAGILVYAYDNDGNVLFLLGKEHYEKGWRGSEKWASFGGTPKMQWFPSLYKEAARETYEETMGILGDVEKLEKHIKTGSYFLSEYSILWLLEIDYNKDIPYFYNNVYTYLTSCMNITNTGKPYIPSCREGYLEKTQLDWFSMRDMRLRAFELRDIFLDEFKKIIDANMIQLHRL